MIQVSPAIRISIGLMFITIAVLLIGNFLGLIPNHKVIAMEARRSTAESIALRCTYAAREKDLAFIKKTMDEIIELYPDVHSLGLRRTDGRYLVQSGEHYAHWGSPTRKDISLTHWQVPMFQGSKSWSTLEIAFAPDDTYVVMGYRLSPFVLLLILSSVISFAGFVMFMKRSLRYLDPSSVMPKRVKYALNTLIEGVLILDIKERIILSNTVFEKKLDMSAKKLIGLKASELDWVDPDTNMPPEILPWIHAISEKETQSGILLNIITSSQGIRNIMINSAPVIDEKGKCRGAVVTFDDVTELEKQSFQLSRMVELLQMSRDEIKNKNKELEILAGHDSLTGCLNRRSFYSSAKEYMEDAKKQNNNLSCIMLDLDLFKFINDTYGHSVGDKVLQYVGSVLQATVRGEDEVCRYGGEEFCLVLPDCDIENAASIAEKIRRKIESQGAQAVEEAPGIRITASFGVSDVHLGAHNVEELLTQADRAMYKAKESGRNRVIVWDAKNEKEVKHKV